MMVSLVPQVQQMTLNRLEALSIATFILFIPFAVLLMRFVGNASLLVFGLIIGAWWLYLGFRLSTWRCPRCHDEYLRGGKAGWVIPFRANCAHCGLPRAELPNYYNQP
jgi:hypothetical protein